MVKKLILTESQYDKLTRFILESTFQEIVDDVVQAGDVLRIGFKDKTRNFKVVNKAGNQIIMDNIDKGSPENVYRAFMSITSFNNGNLELKVVNKETEPDKIGQIGKWTKKIFNNITDIEVIRNDNVIDTVGEEPEKPLEKAVSDDFKTLIDDSILIFINQVKEGSGVVFKVAEENINFCCVGRNGGKFSFELNSDSTNKELTAWDSFAFELKGDGEKEDEDLYELNKHLIKTDDEGQTFNLRLLGSLGEKAKYVWIKNIYDIESTPKCAPKPKKAKEEKPNEKEEEELIDDAKVAMHLILNDPTLKKAFYSQPTLWNLFTAELSGNKATGKGILPTLDIVGSYVDKHIIERLGANFIEGETIKYEVISNPNQVNECKVIKREIEQTDAVLYDEKNKTKILVKNKTTISDVYFCDVKKEVDNKIERGVKIKFFSDDTHKGYNPIVNNHH